jgi:hypothetical protein
MVGAYKQQEMTNQRHKYLYGGNKEISGNDAKAQRNTRYADSLRLCVVARDQIP